MPNMRSWLVGNVFNLNNFNSPNPNQPCNFLNIKIDNLTTWITNFQNQYPNATNHPTLLNKQCKLQTFQALHTWYNC